MKLLFVHGFFGSALNWGSVRNLLEARARELGLEIETFAVDLLGHAHNHPNALGTGTTAHEALVADLKAQISGKGPYVAVGHSFGIRPLILLGNEMPSLIPAIIVEDSSPELRPEGSEFLHKILAETPTPFRSREQARVFFDEKYGKGTALSRFLLSNIRTAAENSYDWRFAKDYLEHLLDEAAATPLWEEWKHYPGTTYLITGERSDLFDGRDTLQKMLALRGASRLPHTTIPGSGHWVHAEKPHEFIEALLKIIQSLPARLL